MTHRVVWAQVSNLFIFLFRYYTNFCILELSTTTNETGHITEGWERDSPGKQVGPNDASCCLGSGKLFFIFLFRYYTNFCILELSTTTNKTGHITEGWERDSPGKQVGPNNVSHHIVWAQVSNSFYLFIPLLY